MMIGAAVAAEREKEVSAGCRKWRGRQKREKSDSQSNADLRNHPYNTSTNFPYFFFIPFLLVTATLGKPIIARVRYFVITSPNTKGMSYVDGPWRKIAKRQTKEQIPSRFFAPSFHLSLSNLASKQIPGKFRHCEKFCRKIYNEPITISMRFIWLLCMQCHIALLDRFPRSDQNIDLAKWDDFSSGNNTEKQISAVDYEKLQKRHLLSIYFLWLRLEVIQFHIL